MSWSFTVGPVPKAEFNASVDAAGFLDTSQGEIGMAEDIMMAKGLLKAAAQRVKRDWVSGSASGHALQPLEDDQWYDGLTISVAGYDAKVVPPSV